MNDENKETVTPEVITTYKETDEDKLDHLLDSLQNGWTVAIHRLSPSWCKSYLERIDILDGDTLDLDYIAETWGGEIIRLRICDERGKYKGSKDIHFRSYPPKFQGRILKRRGLQDLDPDDPAIKNTQLATVQTDLKSTNMNDLIKLIKEVRHQDLSDASKAVSPNPAPNSISDSLNNIQAFGDTYNQLKSMFGNTEKEINEAEPNNQLEMIKTIGELAKGMFSNSSNQNQNQIQGKVIQPQKKLPNEPKKAVSAQEIASYLSNMEPESVSTIALAALSNMDDDKREIVIKKLFDGLGIEEDLSLYEEEEDPKQQESYEEQDHKPKLSEN